MIFGPVSKILPLQGADMVATENYWDAGRWLKDIWLKDIESRPRAHFRHYLRSVRAQGLILDREAIRAELKRRGADGLLL
jgi:hypothetical protein